MVVGILRTAAKPFLAWSIVEDSLFSDADALLLLVKSSTAAPC